MDTGVQMLGDMAVTQAHSARATVKPAANANIDKAAQDFEGMFITQMLQPMFDGMGVNPTFGGGHGEEVMRGFMVQEYGKLIAARGGLGLASAVKAELLKVQQQASQGDAHVDVTH